MSHMSVVQMRWRSITDVDVGRMMMMRLMRRPWDMNDGDVVLILSTAGDIAMSVDLIDAINLQDDMSS
jgi:hypothetical protein